MSSDQQAAAKRRNSGQSRGPTTAAGKSRSRTNALGHGLAATVLIPPHLRDDVQALAKAIAGGDADALGLALGRQIAEAHLDWMRVQTAKVALMNSQLGVTSLAGAPEDEVGETSLDLHLDVPAVDLLDETALTRDLSLVPTLDILHQLARLERYERRAIARCKRAARSFITHQSAWTLGRSPR